MEIKSKARESNFEILRILSMFMIIVLHIGTHGIEKYIDVTLDLTSYVRMLYFIIKSLTTIAVSIYVLISSYFLYKSTFHLEKLIKIILETSFFSVIMYLLSVSSGLIHFNVLTLIQSLFSVLVGEYWFVTVYCLMYALSPLLNKVIENMEPKETFYFTVSSFLVLCCWQYFYPVIQIGVLSGYSLLYFMFLYFIGASIRKYDGVESRFKGYFYLLVYLLLGISNGILVYLVSQFTSSINKLYHYNSPIIFILSLSLFLFFKKLKISSSKINNISKYVFGIYLIHEQKSFKIILWNELGIVERLIENTDVIFIVKMISYSLIIFCLCWFGSFCLTKVYDFLFLKLVKTKKKELN